MEYTIQSAIAKVIVTAAVAFIGKAVIYKWFGSSKSGTEGGCGSCGSCPSAKADAGSEPNVVQIGAPPKR